MNKNHIIGLSLISILSLGSNAFAQNQKLPKAVIEKGHFNLSLRNLDAKSIEVTSQINELLGLSPNNNFVKTKDDISKNGMNHMTFQQYYNGIIVDGGLVKIHSKNGIVTSLNGNVYNGNDLTVTPTLSLENAKAAIISKLGFTQVLHYNNEGLTIFMDNEKPSLTYNTTIIGYNAQKELKNFQVYINANNGIIEAQINNIQHTDVPATGKTVYNGTRSFTADSHDGAYRLVDNERNIFTYNTNSGSPDVEVVDGEYAMTFVGKKDYKSTSTHFDDEVYLSSFKIENLNASFRTGLGSSYFLLGGISKSTDLESEDPMLAYPFDLFETVGTTTGLPAVKHNLYGDIDFDTGYIFFYKVDGGLEFADEFYIPIAFNNTVGEHTWSSEDGLTSGTYTISSKANPANDVHWGMTVTHDYFMDRFDRNSYDGENGKITNYLNGTMMLSFTKSNAFALQHPTNALVYGLGDDVHVRPFVNLDIISHEFVHLLTAKTAALIYRGESGALNEAFSDIFGTAIEHYALEDEADWLMANDVVINAPYYFRNMADPKAPAGFSNPFATAGPHTYGEEFWADPENLSFDEGGVHINSSILNKWFQLLVQGGTGTNDKDYTYNVNPIGWEKAEDLSYMLLTQYLYRNAKYHNAYDLSIEYFRDAYGEETPEMETLKEAWKAVGIPKESGVNDAVITRNSISIYPNPSNGSITINANLKQAVNAEVFNITGKKVSDINLTNGVNQLDLTHLSSGTYILKYNENNNVSIAKFVIN